MNNDTEKRTETHACDTISRQAAITAIQKAYADTEGGTDKCAVWKNVGLTNALHIMQDLPSARQDVPDTNVGDMISRQAAIDTEGLDEQIRCEMCRNPMHTDRGCDGNCKYDEKLYGRIMQILGERIKPLPPAQPKRCSDCIAHGGDWECDHMHCRKGRLPSAQPDIIRCKDCKHRPFDGEDTQGFGVEFPDEKCPCQCDDGWYNWRPNDEWFCANAERRTDGF